MPRGAAKRKNLTGQRFGRLVAVSDVGVAGGSRLWLCRCDCGNEKTLKSSYLLSGDTRSCGCLAKAIIRDRNQTHGLSKTPEYRTWAAMLDRCGRTPGQGREDYAGRGVRVCERWAVFENFYSDMGPKPSPNHSLDRIDNNGPYSPDNCRWASRTTQNRNRRGRHYLTYLGETLTTAEWSERTGISCSVIKGRLSLGWSIEKTLTALVNHPKTSL